MHAMARTEQAAVPSERAPWRRGAYWIAIGFAIVSGLTYWIIASIMRGHSPFDITILYRFGDTDDIPLFYALSRFQFHEFITTGIEPPRLILFPPGLSFFYALPIAAFGSAGFPLADVIVNALRMVACLVMARIFFRSPAAIAAAAVAVFVLTGPLPLLSRYWVLFYRPLWDLRYLRPFVTGIFALSLVINSHYLNDAFLRRLPSLRMSALQGVLIGLVIQGDLHLGIIACFVSATLYLYALLRAPSSMRVLVTSALVFALALLAMLPFMILEVANAIPDATRRLGQIPLSRTSPPLMWGLVPWQDISLLAALSAFVSWRKVGGDDLRDGRRIITMTLFWAVMAPLSLPLSVIILGRGVQIHHFPYDADGFVILGFALVGLIVASVAFDWLAKRFSRRAAAVAVCVTVALLAGMHFLFLGFRTFHETSDVTQQRAWEGDGWAPIMGYHADLDALWRELSRPQYSKMHVLATFDHQLGMLWMTRSSHWLWLPDPFLTTVPDAAIEKRVISFFQLIGMTREDFDRHLGEAYFVTEILNSWEWPEHRPPQSERLRLDAMYSLPQSVDGVLDILILVRDSDYGNALVPRPGFTKTYENGTFSVWVRDEAPPTSSHVEGTN